MIQSYNSEKIIMEDSLAKIYYYPSCPPGGYGNPYSPNVKKAWTKFGVVLDNNNTPVKPAIKGLLKNCCVADVFLLNWIEGIANHRGGFVQYFLAKLCLLVIKIRNRKIVWTLHNIHPHGGANDYSDKMSNYLYKHADIIIAHSKDAQEYAEKKASCPVYYVCHPFNTFGQFASKQERTQEVLIWGTIYPYKGIAQFLQEVNSRNVDLSIRIVGTCSDSNLLNEIVRNIQNNHKIVFENRRPSFEEIGELISTSKYVLFPYVGGGVSSSGALMDTIAMGGIAMGPNIGAFKDLSKDGICMAYNDYDDMFKRLKTSPEISKQYVGDFVKQNSWENFAKFVFEHLKK